MDVGSGFQGLGLNDSGSSNNKYPKHSSSQYPGEYSTLP